MTTEATAPHTHIVSFGMTDVGLERKNNEDAFKIVEDAGLYVVCDGMGGHASGELASRIAVDTIAEFVTETIHEPGFRWPFNSPSATTLETRVLDSAVRMANRRVHEAAVADPRHKGMGTTVVALLAGNDQFGAVHVGDSRIYRMRAGALEQLTDDHSLLNHYKKTRNMTEEQLRNFKGKNVIVRAVGLRDAVQPEVNVFDVMAGDIFLLCTDGLTDLVPDDKLHDEMVLGRTNLEQGVQHLVKAALAKGGRDNITVVMLRVESGGGAHVHDQHDVVGEDTSPGFDAVDDGNWDQETLPAYDTSALEQVRGRADDDTPDAMPAVPSDLIIDMATDPGFDAVVVPERSAGVDSNGAAIPAPPGAVQPQAADTDSKGAPIPPPPGPASGLDSKGAPIPLPPGTQSSLPPGIEAEETAPIARPTPRPRPPSAQLKATHVEGKRPARTSGGRSTKPPKAENPFARTRVETGPPKMDLGAAPAPVTPRDAAPVSPLPATPAIPAEVAPALPAESMPAGDIGAAGSGLVGNPSTPNVITGELPTAPYRAVTPPSTAVEPAGPAVVVGGDDLSAHDIFNVPTLEQDIIVLPDSDD